jgi:hypothetical protein
VQIFIQNCKTKLLLKAGCEWTDNIKEALRFESSTGAIALCRENSIPDTQLIYAFDDPMFNFISAISASCR